MTHDEQQHANPLQQLKADISALEERDRMWAAHVQVPRTRANVLAGMSEQEWHDGSGGWLDNDLIRSIIDRTTAKGASALSGLVFGTTCIKVAASAEDDCKELKILEGRPMEESTSL